MFKLSKIINLRPADFLKDFSSIKQYLIREYQDTKTKLQDIPQTNYELGLRHLGKRNLVDAIMRFKMVIKLREKDFNSYYYLAQALILADRKDEAQKYIKSALILEPTNQEALYIQNKILAPETIAYIPEKIISDTLNWEYSYRPNKLGYEQKICDKIIKSILAFVRDKNPNLAALEFGVVSPNFAIALHKKDVLSSIEAVTYSNAIYNKLFNLNFNAEKVFNKLHLHNLISSFDDIAKESKYDLIVTDKSLHFSSNLSVLVGKLASSLKDNGLIAAILPVYDQDESYTLSIKQDLFHFSRSYIINEFIKTGLKQLDVINLNELKLTISKDDETNLSSKEREKNAPEPTEILVIFQKQ